MRITGYQMCLPMVSRPGILMRPSDGPLSREQVDTSASAIAVVGLLKLAEHAAECCATNGVS